MGAMDFIIDAIIEPARPEDFDEVMKLLEQLWPGKPLNREGIGQVYLEALDSTLQEYLVARAGERTVGFVSLRIMRNLWAQGSLLYIEELVIDEQYRNQKIGSRLLDEAARFAEASHCNSIEVPSAFHRQDAHRFYERWGFAKKAYHFFYEMPE